MSEQSIGDELAPEPGGFETYEGSALNNVDLALLKDFLLVLQGCQVARFSGYGVAVDFRGEDSADGFAPGALGTVASLPDDAPAIGREPRDAWRNPNLWPQQNGRVLKFDGSFE